jgi:voltage-gated potassium channel
MPKVADNPNAAGDGRSAIRRRLYEILEQGTLDDRLGRIVNRALVLVIIVNLVALVMGSVPAVAAGHEGLFRAIEFFSLVLFSVEYGLRIWIAADPMPRHGLTRRHARIAYVTSGSGLIDLVAVLPFWIGLFLAADLRVLLVFRFVRFLKLTRYSPAMRSLLSALYAERRALFGCMVIFAGTTLIAGSIMHVVEGEAQPDKFGTIPDAMWWALVTLGTIGYGDVVPVTALGRIVAAFTIFGGLIMIALPVGIVATAFANEIHRRDFVITLGMVARVPLFSGLTAGEIADVMRLLSARTVEPGGIIVRRGERGHSMYFIAAGEVEIDLPNERVRFGIGHFFGEIAVLRRTRRSATATAITRTNLLVLEGNDLHALMERNQNLAERIRKVARERLGHDIVSVRGDIVTEELEEGDAEPPPPG